MEKKFKVNEILANVEKAAKDLVDNAMRKADRNDDGKFDFDDVSQIAAEAGKSIKRGARAVKTAAEEKAREMELKNLRPIFYEDINNENFIIPKFIRVADRDKKYLESEVCQGSIGYVSNKGGMNVVNVFTDSVNSFGIALYPNNSDEFYYADPSDSGRYISLNEYFSYLKIAKVNELQKIAQDLGAKYFKVTYKEEKQRLAKKSAKAKAKAGKNNAIDGKTEEKITEYENAHIEAESVFTPHAPVAPKLKYLESDISIKNLIDMRMDENGPMLGQKLLIKMSNSSGMKKSDALKIDSVLKGFKSGGEVTVEERLESESRKLLEYIIEF